MALMSAYSLAVAADMSATPAPDLESAEKMAMYLMSERNARGRIGRVRNYLDGKHDMPYMPKGATREYRLTAERSVTNWLPLVLGTFTKSLRVEGLRGTLPDQPDPTSAPDPTADPAGAQKALDAAKAATMGNADKAPTDDVWYQVWQRNRLDAGQAMVYDGALAYGASWVCVLPSVDGGVSVDPIDASRAFAYYADDDDETPTLALVYTGATLENGERFKFYAPGAIYALQRDTRGDPLRVVGTAPTGMDFVPWVRFRPSLTDKRGIIKPLIPLQDQINESMFMLRMVLISGAHRQRWATGMVIPTDPTTGKPVEPFNSAVDRLWVAEDAETKFGDFAQTDVTGHINTYIQSVRTLAALAQINPSIMTGDLINLSADALAQIDAQTTRRVDELATIFGESWEQVFRLGAEILGAGDVASDEALEVRWADAEARAFATQVTALGVLAEKLKAPVVELWEEVPGMTPAKLERWRSAHQSEDTYSQLLAATVAAATPAPSDASQSAQNGGSGTGTQASDSAASTGA